jgi:hypothetical protein
MSRCELASHGVIEQAPLRDQPLERSAPSASRVAANASSRAWRFVGSRSLFLDALVCGIREPG